MRAESRCRSSRPLARRAAGWPRSPDRPGPTAAARRRVIELKSQHGKVICRATYEDVPSSGRGRFLVALLPTAFPDRPEALAPSGVWQVKLRNKGLQADEAVHLWIQRDDTPHGYPLLGRQSYFEDDDYERFDA